MDMRLEHKACEVKTDDTLYRIGMFAAMNHVTVKTLRFYEEQGLLAPALIPGDRIPLLHALADGGAPSDYRAQAGGLHAG